MTRRLDIGSTWDMLDLALRATTEPSKEKVEQGPSNDPPARTALVRCVMIDVMDMKIQDRLGYCRTSGDSLTEYENKKAK